MYKTKNEFNIKILPSQELNKAFQTTGHKIAANFEPLSVSKSILR